MKWLREIAALFAADTLVLITVPGAALFAFVAAHWLPHAIVALVLLALLAGSFSLGIWRGARSLSGS
jgi:hypothetical protein